MKRLFTWVCLLAFTASVVGTATAADEKPKKKAPDKAAQFGKLDTNGDKQLTLEEFKGKKKGKALENAEKAFGRLNTDKKTVEIDGKEVQVLTLAEFSAAPKPKKGKKKPE